jgi:hypothetical protein
MAKVNLFYSEQNPEKIIFNVMILSGGIMKK